MRAGDSFARHNAEKFTTIDNDNDYNEGPVWDPNCAVQFRGGWWYNNCCDCNLNGAHGIDSHIGITWRSWHGTDYSIPFVELKMKPM